MDQLQHLRLQPRRPEAAQQVGKPRGMVDQVRSPFWSKHVSNGCNRLMKGSGQLMLGLSDLGVRAEAPGGKLSIGRVAEHHINTCCRHQCVNLTEVALYNLDAILQPVELSST